MIRATPRGGCASVAVPPPVTTHLRLVEPVPTTGWKTVAPNIQHTPGGGYRVRQRVGRKRITLGVFATFAEALAVQAASIEEVRSRGLSKRPTLETWMPTWFERREKSDVRSVDSERNRARKHVYGTKLARIPLDEIRRVDILGWLRELEAKHVDYEGQRVGWARKKAAQEKASGKTPKRRARRSASTKTKTLGRQTRLHCLKLIRGALNAAVDEEYIEENPALGINLPKEARVDDESTVLTPAEQTRLLEVVPLPEKWIVAAAIGGGWRMGEQWSLEIDGVHLDSAVPYLDVRYGGVGRKPTKSGQPRQVPLVGPALEAMREWLAVRASWCKRLKCALVFPTLRGAHRRKKPPRGWKECLRKAGIVRRVRWHDLRHTCASALLSGQWGRKWSMEEVQKFLGHKSIRTTERYARFADDALMKAAAETTAALAASKGDAS